MVLRFTMKIMVINITTYEDNTDDLSKSFHTYSVDLKWGEYREIVFKFDDIIVSSQVLNQSKYDELFYSIDGNGNKTDKYYALILNIALDGIYNNGVDHDTAMRLLDENVGPAEMIIEDIIITNDVTDPEPVSPSPTVITFSGTFGGTTSDNNTYTFPSGAVPWGGFVNEDTSVYPFQFQMEVL